MKKSLTKSHCLIGDWRSERLQLLNAHIFILEFLMLVNFYYSVYYDVNSYRKDFVINSKEFHCIHVLEAENVSLLEHPTQNHILMGEVVQNPYILTCELYFTNMEQVLSHPLSQATPIHALSPDKREQNRLSYRH